MLRKLFAFIFFIYPVFLKGIIVESPKFFEIKRYIVNHRAEKVLIVCDIDNTLLRATQHLGSVAWGDSMIEELVSKGVSKEEAEEIESILWRTVQPFVKVQAVDPESSFILESLQDRGFLILGLTARCPNEAEYTMQQLRSIGINLGQLKQPFTFESLSQEGHKPLYSQGILFGTPFNKKSQILFKFLEENKLHPECIIFIDDKLSHLEDLSKECKGRNISFTGIRFSGADDVVKAFKPQIADIQWTLFPTLISDKQAEKVLINLTQERNY